MRAINRGWFKKDIFVSVSDLANELEEEMKNINDPNAKKTIECICEQLRSYND